VKLAFSEIEEFGEEAMLVWCKILLWNSSGGSDENPENVRQNRPCPGQDSNRTPPELKQETLPLDLISWSAIFFKSFLRVPFALVLYGGELSVYSPAALCLGKETSVPIRKEGG
jgi:hypothetical protein